MVAERVWLVHRGGFAAARVLHPGMPGAEGVENLPEGKCRVRLEHGGEVLDVDEEDVEKVNTQLKGSVKELYISIYFFFLPITQWCPVSDVLFTGGRECQILVL